MTIEVIYIKSEYPLGTEDGSYYSIYPPLPDDDEVGNHGSQS